MEDGGTLGVTVSPARAASEQQEEGLRADGNHLLLDAPCFVFILIIDVLWLMLQGFLKKPDLALLVLTHAVHGLADRLDDGGARFLGKQQPRPSAGVPVRSCPARVPLGLGHDRGADVVGERRPDGGETDEVGGQDRVHRRGELDGGSRVRSTLGSTALSKRGFRWVELVGVIGC